MTKAAAAAVEEEEEEKEAVEAPWLEEGEKENQWCNRFVQMIY
jgi:hypothetical protein